MITELKPYVKQGENRRKEPYTVARIYASLTPEHGPFAGIKYSAYLDARHPVAFVPTWMSESPYDLQMLKHLFKAMDELLPQARADLDKLIGNHSAAAAGGDDEQPPF